MSTTNQDRVRLTPPATGRLLAENGAIVNQADRMRQDMLGVWRGEFPGATYFGADGECTTTGAVTNRPLWPGGSVLPDTLSVGKSMSVVSTSVEDAPAGTGARVVYIDYLDNALSPRTTTIALNGLTPVLTSVSDIRWIQNAVVISADLSPGSPRTAVGNISFTHGGTAYAIIPANTVVQASSFRMVPRGYTVNIRGFLLSSTSSTADAKALIRTVVRSNDLLIPGGSVGTQNGGIAASLDIGYPLLPGTILGLAFDGNKALTATGTVVGWMEPYSG